jgi:serine/threonine protein phosphatase PrpC
LEGYVVSVIDGHGGWQLAELAMSKLHDLIDENLAKCEAVNPLSIKKAIDLAFQ